MSVTRRDFLAAGLVGAASGVIVPPVLAKGVFAAGIEGIHNDRVLVVAHRDGEDRHRRVDDLHRL